MCLQEFQNHIPTVWFWSDLLFSIYMDTGDSNHIWCVAAVLPLDPRLSGGPRWQSQGQGEEESGGGDKSEQHLTAGEPCVWECRTQTVPDVCLRGDGVVCETPLELYILPCRLPFTSVPWKSKQGLLMPRDRQEWYFPHHIRRLNTSNDSNADKHKSTSLWYKFKFKSVTQLLFLI